MNKYEIRANIVYARKQRLIMMWCGSQSALYKKRCMRLVVRLEEEFRLLEKVDLEFKRKEREDKRDFDNQLVLLSCHNFTCQTGLGIPMKAHFEKTHYCATCSREMITEDDFNIKIVLARQGIYTPWRYEDED